LVPIERPAKQKDRIRAVLFESSYPSAITAVLAMSPASAAMMACTSENMAKSVAAGDAMQEGPVKRAMLKELGDANTAMSKGDMRGACKSYMRAQKMGSTKS
jgi:hypothetical protein